MKNNFIGRDERNEFTKQQEESVHEAVIEKTKRNCIACGSEKISIPSGYFMLQSNSMNDDGELTRTKFSIPCIMIICQDCGFISQHALGALGLLSDNMQEVVRHGNA